MQIYGHSTATTRALKGNLVVAGLRDAAGVFAVTGDDSKNKLISLTAKQLNPAARVVARVHDVRNSEQCCRDLSTAA
jgi:Trk K+ transport system NAD-binding subunit